MTPGGPDRSPTAHDRFSENGSGVMMKIAPRRPEIKAGAQSPRRPGAGIVFERYLNGAESPLCDLGGATYHPG